MPKNAVESGELASSPEEDFEKLANAKSNASGAKAGRELERDKKLEEVMSHVICIRECESENSTRTARKLEGQADEETGETDSVATCHKWFTLEEFVALEKWPTYLLTSAVKQRP